MNNTPNIKELLDEEMNSRSITPNVDAGWAALQQKLQTSGQQNTPSKPHRYFSKAMVTAASVALVVLLPVASVWAYEHYQSLYKVPHIEQNVMVGDASLDNTVTVRNEQVDLSMDNLRIEWLGQTRTEDDVLMKFRLWTTDGSPLITDAPDKAPVYVPLAFETVTLTAGDEVREFPGVYEPYALLPQDYYIGCTSIAEDYSSADFELSIHDPSLHLDGQEISLRFTNLDGSFHTFTDLETGGTLADLLAPYADPADDSTSHENLHIVFSDAYPECYIDSFSFESDTIFENPEQLLHIYSHGKNMFTMTVVCDDTSRDTIRNMVFQNTDTGFNGTAELQVKELEDGRLRFYYSVNYDGSYMSETYVSKGGEPRDTTMDDLSHLVLKLNGTHVTETLRSGSIEEKIILE